MNYETATPEEIGKYIASKMLEILKQNLKLE